MSDLIKTAIEGTLKPTLQQYAGRTVTYQRLADGFELVVIATLDDKLLQVEDEFGEWQLVHSDRTYLIAADLLVQNSQQFEPARGDKVIEGTELFEVFPPGPREAAWQWADELHRRVFAKYRGIEP